MSAAEAREAEVERRDAASRQLATDLKARQTALADADRRILALKADAEAHSERIVSPADPAPVSLLHTP